MTIGMAIRDRRKALGMNRETVAVKAGVSAATIGRIERGSHSSTIAVLSAVADALDWTLPEMLAAAHTIEPAAVA